MKILDIITSLNPADGGPQHTVRTMSQMWRNAGHQADILTLDAPDAPYLEPGLPVHALGTLGAPARKSPFATKLAEYRAFPGAVSQAARIVRDYDTVVVHGLWNASTLLSRLVLRDGKVPYFVFVHGMLDPWHKEAYPIKDIAKQVIWPLREGALVNRAQAAFFTTQVEIDLANGRYVPYRINAELVGYGCQGPGAAADAQIAAFHDRFPKLRDRKFMIFLSRIHPKKGCDTILRAFAHCLPELGDMDLVMAGPDQIGWQKTLEALAEELGIADRVHWTGLISGPVKWGAFRAAEAFVLPSHGENFGIVVAEAMACGTPVIISDRVNLYHAVVDHGAGLVAPHDLDSTIGAFQRFARMSTAERTQMGRNAAECYHVNYELESASQRVLDTIARYLRRNEPPAMPRTMQGGMAA